MSELVYLSLGSNLGDRAASLHEAIRRLESVGRVQAVSPLYETEPVEFTTQPWFLNCALSLETTSRPEELICRVLQIEKAMGRERDQPKGPRTIDIDILLFGDAIVSTPSLTIPHPAMAQRRFVLEAVAEISPEVKHPTLKKSVRELLAELPAGQSVRRWTGSHPNNG